MEDFSVNSMVKSLYGFVENRRYAPHDGVDTYGRVYRDLKSNYYLEREIRKGYIRYEADHPLLGRFFDVMKKVPLVDFLRHETSGLSILGAASVFLQLCAFRAPSIHAVLKILLENREPDPVTRIIANCEVNIIRGAERARRANNMHKCTLLPMAIVIATFPQIAMGLPTEPARFDWWGWVVKFLVLFWAFRTFRTDTPTHSRALDDAFEAARRFLDVEAGVARRNSQVAPDFVQSMIGLDAISSQDVTKTRSLKLWREIRVA